MFLQKNAKKFGHVKKKQYFCTRFSEKLWRGVEQW